MFSKNSVDYDEPLCIRYGQDGSACGMDYLPGPTDFTSGIFDALAAPIMDLIAAVLMVLLILCFMCCCCYVTRENGLLSRIIAMKLAPLQQRLQEFENTQNSRTEHFIQTNTDSDATPPQGWV